MILVDSSVWIGYFNGASTPQVDRLDALLGSEEIAIGDLILVEVLQGFQRDRDYRQARDLLMSLTLVSLGGESIAVQAADNFRTLRALGVTVRKTIDTVIATWCIENRQELLHDDRVFEPFVTHLGLRVAKC